MYKHQVTVKVNKGYIPDWMTVWFTTDFVIEIQIQIQTETSKCALCTVQYCMDCRLYGTVQWTRFISTTGTEYRVVLQYSSSTRQLVNHAINSMANTTHNITVKSPMRMYNMYNYG